LNTIDYLEPAREVELCNLGDTYHFRIVRPEPEMGCLGIANQWTDPVTKITYHFSGCDVPSFLTRIECGSEVQIITEDKPYYVLIDAKNSSCSGFDFDGLLKKITMKITATALENRMHVTIPRELLGGKFSLMIDGGGTEDFSVDNRQGYSVVSFGKFCPLRCTYDVEITGTEATSSELLSYSPPKDHVPFTNVRGEWIQELHVDQQVIFLGNFHLDNLEQTKPYMVLVEFRNAQGITESIAWQSGVAKPYSTVGIGVSWMPEIREDYSVIVNVISDFENPEVLSPGYSFRASVL
jgi:hypothetical protein